MFNWALDTFNMLEDSKLGRRLILLQKAKVKLVMILHLLLKQKLCNLIFQTQIIYVSSYGSVTMLPEYIIKYEMFRIRPN